MKEVKTIIREEQEEQNDILDLYQKIEDFKNKLSFLTVVMTRMLSEEEFAEDVVNGYQLIMISLEDELEQIDSILTNLLDKQRIFESAEVRIKAGFIKTLDEDIDIVKKYIEYIDKMKVRAEDVLLIKYQKAKNRE
jgi:hypothetical protein